MLLNPNFDGGVTGATAGTLSDWKFIAKATANTAAQAPIFQAGNSSAFALELYVNDLVTDMAIQQIVATTIGVEYAFSFEYKILAGLEYEQLVCSVNSTNDDAFFIELGDHPFDQWNYAANSFVAAGPLTLLTCEILGTADSVLIDGLHLCPYTLPG